LRQDRHFFEAAFWKAHRVLPCPPGLPPLGAGFFFFHPVGFFLEEVHFPCLMRFLPRSAQAFSSFRGEDRGAFFRPHWFGQPSPGLFFSGRRVFFLARRPLIFMEVPLSPSGGAPRNGREITRKTFSPPPPENEELQHPPPPMEFLSFSYRLGHSSVGPVFQVSNLSFLIGKGVFLAEGSRSSLRTASLPLPCGKKRDFFPPLNCLLGWSSLRRPRF